MYLILAVIQLGFVGWILMHRTANVMYLILAVIQLGFVGWILMQSTINSMIPDAV